MLPARRFIALLISLFCFLTVTGFTAPRSHADEQPMGGDSRIGVPPASKTTLVDDVERNVIAELPARQVDEFTMLGFTWSQLTTSDPATTFDEEDVKGIVIQFRTRQQDRWSDWLEVDVHQDEAVDGGQPEGRPGSEPIWVGMADGIEARVLAPSASDRLHDLRVSLINSEPLASDGALEATTPQNVGSAPGGTLSKSGSLEPEAQLAAVVNYVAQPAIITRAQWSADESLLSTNGSGCVPPDRDRTVKSVVVHHTAGSNSYTKAQAASVVRGTYRYHVVDRGWCDIGYNFLVDRYGQIFEGRHGGITYAVHGAHATYWNTNSVGVSVMMNSSSAVVPAASLESVAKVIAWKLANNYRDPLAKIYLHNGTYNTILRHGDVMSTSCPGTSITSRMDTIRQRVASLMGSWRTPLYNTWQSMGGENGWLGSPREVEKWVASGRMTRFNGATLYLKPTGSTVWMNRTLDAKYEKLGGPAGSLGWPKASQSAGKISNTERVVFGSAELVSSSSAGAHLLSGQLASYWNGSATVRAKLGMPTSDPISASGRTYQTFQQGRLDLVNGSVQLHLGVPSRAHGDQTGDRIADLLFVPSGSDVIKLAPVRDLKSQAAENGSSGFRSTTWLSQVPDLNGDGYSDLVTKRSDGTLWFQLGLGHGTFATARQIGHGWNGMQHMFLAPDMNKDGRPELVAVARNGDMLRYGFRGFGGVLPGQRIGHGWNNMRHITTIGALTTAGRVDVQAVTPDGKLWSYHGRPDGRLSGRHQIGHGFTAFKRLFSVGDVTGDGRWDLLGVTSSAPSTIRTYRADTNRVLSAGVLVSNAGPLGVVG